jgi:acyl-coenzyme A synthetase/AMP-(fatty) acid ligase
MINVPKVSNMHFFNESSLKIEKISTAIESKINKKINSEEYELFCRNKFRKPLFDLYALFNPFNEANKAFYPFIPYLKKYLKKGDIILDVWSRTGWSTSLLAGLFPEQKIISIWEGDTDVLGYNGFSYWFSNDKDKPTNIEIYFCDLTKKLPFEDEFVSFVFGFDVLHRQLKSGLLNEIVRVSKQDGLILFPHVHLANDEPIPYFNRCGNLIHGEEYDSFFKNLKPHHKKGYVFSEPDLYRKSYDPDYTVKAHPTTSDYNGLVVITNYDLDLENELSSFDYFDYFELHEGNLLLNPLLEIDSTNIIKFRTSSIAEEVTSLLANHPVYYTQIKKSIGYKLSNEELVLLYWAKKNRSCSFIQQQLQLDSDALKVVILKLQNLDIIQIAPISSKQSRLQHYFAYQEFNEDVAQINLQYLWKRAVANFSEKTYALDRNDDTFYTFQEFNEIVNYITSTFIQKGFKKGDKIILHSEIHFEAMGLFWACMSLGIIYIPINAAIPEATFNDLVQKYDPKIIFLNDKEGLENTGFANTIYFDFENESHSSDKLFFSEWLLEIQESIVLPTIVETDLAVILHTSGSSGTPKGVKLSQGQLFQSAKNMVKTYLWNATDHYLSIGNLDSMSGLRNACIVTAASGASCIIPSFNEKNNPNLLLDCIYETNTTFLIASPSLLNQFLKKKEIKNRLSRVKGVLSTGSNLSTHFKEEFLKKTNKRILNYYGLTETTGFCLGESLNSENFNGNNIGTTVDCIAQIVDENNRVVQTDAIGELRIYSYCISEGYYDTPVAHNEIQRWFYTGDLARMNIDGEVELLGRKKDFIKNARSEIVYFKEIEDALMNISFLNDIGIISFFESESEKIALFVELNSMHPSVGNQIEKIKTELIQKIGSSKVPSVIKIIEKIPRTSNGKLINAELNKYL